MENSTILLSGAGGMLGRYISARARAAGHRIIPLVSRGWLHGPDAAGTAGCGHPLRGFGG